MFNMKRYWFLTGICFFAAFLHNCTSNKVKETVLPNDMKKFYLDSGWIPLDIPDSKYSPGVIVQITSDNRIQFVSYLHTCGVPNDITSPVVGNSPSLTFNGTSDYQAQAVLSINGIEAGPQFSKIKRTTLKHIDHGGDAIDILKLQIWLADPSNSEKVPAPCKAFLSAPNNYIVRESYRVSKGNYTLFDENNTQISLGGIALGPLTLSGNAHAHIIADGSLEFTETVYTAIKKLRDVNGLLSPQGRGSSDDDSDDNKVKKVLFPNYKTN